MSKGIELAKGGIWSLNGHVTLREIDDFFTVGAGTNGLKILSVYSVKVDVCIWVEISGMQTCLMLTVQKGLEKLRSFP